MHRAYDTNPAGVTDRRSGRRRRCQPGSPHAEAAAIRTKIVKRLEHEVGAKLRS